MEGTRVYVYQEMKRQKEHVVLLRGTDVVVYPHGVDSTLRVVYTKNETANSIVPCCPLQPNIQPKWSS